MSPSCCRIFVWPRQIELRAGKHVVRPRYEVLAGERRRIAHVNVERADLRPDPELPELAALLGKGYLLPAPILPATEWESVLLPTPMALSQTELPLAALVYDREGSEVARHAARPDAARSRDGAALRRGRCGLASYGHVELVYDFAQAAPAAAATAGCTRCSAIAIATAGTSPRPASARMCSTRCWSIAASRNPMPARRRAFRRGCSCVSATARTTRCAI